VSELLGGTEGDKQQMAIDAINGAIFYHATRKLGIAVLETLDAGFGGATLDKHEGIVMRDKDVFGVSFPIKITGDFIYTGASGAISDAMSVKEPAQVEAGIKRKIAVFPGAFKPPHRGHMDVVEHFASVADKVVILISPLSRKTPAGKEINKSVSEKIWQIYIDAKGIGNKVSIGSSPYNSPVQASFEVLKGNVPDFVPQAGDLIIPVASDKPDKKGTPDYTRFLKFHEGLPDMIPGVVPANIEEFFYKAPSEGALSASDFRAALDTGEGLERFLPTSVSAQEVLAVLGVEPEPEVEEPEIDEPEDSGAPPAIFMGEDLIRMVEEALQEKKEDASAMHSDEYDLDSAAHREEVGKGFFGGFRQMRFDAHKKAREIGAKGAKLKKALSEEELEEMSSMGGGSVEGFAGPGRKEDDEKTIIREDEIEVIEEVMNYLLSKLEIL
jgi:cytidyltransferase-like protein